MPNHEVTTSVLAAVQQLLEKSAGGDPSAFGGLAIWTFSREQFLNTTLGGLALIALPAPKKSCCSAAASPVASALLLGLRGEQPFDGTQYPRLPWGRAPLPDDEIETIAQWIADGAPELSASAQQYQLANQDWTTHTEMLELQPTAWVDVAQAFSEYQGSTNAYRFQKGELRQRVNVDCMTPGQLEKLRYAFQQLYALNDWPEDARSYNNMALIHQNHCQHGWERFLPWHRIYLYEMEQVIQYFCSDVTLPYWDWTMPQYRPAQPDKGEIIPPALQAFLTEASLTYLAMHGIPTEALQPIVNNHYASQSRFLRGRGRPHRSKVHTRQVSRALPGCVAGRQSVVVSAALSGRIRRLYDQQDNPLSLSDRRRHRTDHEPANVP